VKVLHVNSEKSWRGGEQQMASLMKILNNEGVKSSLLARKSSEAYKRLKAENFEAWEAAYGGLNLSSSLKLKRLMKDFDIIHTHTANAHTVAYLASVWGGKTPIIVSKRTDFPVKSLRKFNHSNIKRILCVSNKITEITRGAVKEPNRVQTVYSGIDTSRFDGKQKDLRDIIGLARNAPLIGNCSALAPHKDYFTFIDVAKNFPEQNFVIIGDGPLKSELQEYGKDLSNLFFTGFLPDIQCYLKSLDYFLMTSETEGLGTSLLDAMICRIPIVSTRAGGIPEIVIDNKTGYLANIGSVDELSSQLRKMISDQNTRSKLIENAYQNVKEHFTREITAKQTLKIYKEILG
tara:strand:+ start:25979 stop:27022 length:1044 start_codon:yes stop_codon:yes gene_type:complete